MRTFIIVFLSLILSWGISAQDLEFARKQIDTLASESMHGRGYVNNGDHIAKDYLLEQFKEIRLQKWKGTYLQKYNFPINTFPGNMKMIAGNKEMKPGYDFQVKVWSNGIKDTLKTLKLRETHLADDKKLKSMRKQDLSDYMIVINPRKIDDKFEGSFRNIAEVNFFGAAGYIILKDTEKLSWSVSGTEKRVDHTVIEVKENSWNNANEVIINIESEFQPEHEAYNIMGYLPGRKHPDSIVMVTAHYDHLGRMGQNTCYCGAHDNASGVALSLELADYFAVSQYRPEYSMMFVLFSGEEAGLHGSQYFVNNPPVDLDKIKMSFNLDLVGSGNKGITVVNGAVLEEKFKPLKEINKEKAYVQQIRKRGEAANSDHYPLYTKGVPSFFIYTVGDEYTEYHNPDDRAEDLPLTAYKGLFKLIRDYVKQL